MVDPSLIEMPQDEDDATAQDDGADTPHAKGDLR